MRRERERAGSASRPTRRDTSGGARFGSEAFVAQRVDVESGDVVRGRGRGEGEGEVGEAAFDIEQYYWDEGPQGLLDKHW